MGVRRLLVWQAAVVVGPAPGHPLAAYGPPRGTRCWVLTGRPGCVTEGRLVRDAEGEPVGVMEPVYRVTTAWQGPQGMVSLPHGWVERLPEFADFVTLRPWPWAPLDVAA